MSAEQRESRLRGTSGWLKGPAFDLLGLAFCWLPIYAWTVWGLGLGGDVGRESYPALATAMGVVLCLTFVHRHYTFVLVYGDKETFAKAPRAFVLAPLFLIGAPALAALSETRLSLMGAEFRPLVPLLILSGSWNIWHTIQQRYGILRAYAAKGKVRQDRSDARLDQALLWCLTLCIVVWLPILRPETFRGHPSAQRVLRVIEGPAAALHQGALWLVSAVTLIVVLAYMRSELQVRAPARQRVPRLLFLGSTLALFGVFLTHGPIAGYLCFGSAHAIEYIAFVHLYGEKRWSPRDPSRSFAGVLFSRAWLYAPILVGIFGGFFWLVRDGKGSIVYIAYYLGTSMMHFLFDGWIWKMRSPNVRMPIAGRTQ